MFCFCPSNWILSFCPHCTYSSIITFITFGHIRVNSVTCIWSIHRNGYHQYVSDFAPGKLVLHLHHPSKLSVILGAFLGDAILMNTVLVGFLIIYVLLFDLKIFFVLMAFYHMLLKWFHLEWGEKRICLQGRRPEFDSWVGKIPWWKKWLPIPILLFGGVHGQRSLVSDSPWGHKELDMTKWLTLSLSCLKINF